MHSHSLEPWQHRHVYLGAKHDRHERRTWFVVALTAAMMVAEIVGGTIYGSMALENAARSPNLPVPKVKRALRACRRANR